MAKPSTIQIAFRVFDPQLCEDALNLVETHSTPFGRTSLGVVLWHALAWWTSLSASERTDYAVSNYKYSGANMELPQSAYPTFNVSMRDESVVGLVDDIVESTNVRSRSRVLFDALCAFVALSHEERVAAATESVRRYGPATGRPGRPSIIRRKWSKKDA